MTEHTRRPGRHRRLLATALLVFVTTGCYLPRWPADARITSDYGLRFRGLRPDLHHGVDLDVPTGSPVVAMARGRVRFSGVMRGFGNVIWIDHPGGFMSVYAHLSRLQVEEGQAVETGEHIGLSGATGDVTAPHLHFEVWRWGRSVDPVPVLGGKPGR